MKAKSPFAPSNLLAGVQSSLREDIKTARARLDTTKSPRIKEAVTFLGMALRRAHLVHEGDHTVGHTEYVSTYNESVEATIYLNVSALKGNPKLESFLSWMLDWFEPTRSYDHATDYGASRTFNFKLKWEAESWNPPLRVEVVCRIDANSDTCRKVVVGTKLVEEKVYAIECV